MQNIIIRLSRLFRLKTILLALIAPILGITESIIANYLTSKGVSVPSNIWVYVVLVALLAVIGYVLVHDDKREDARQLYLTLKAIKRKEDDIIAEAIPILVEKEKQTDWEEIRFGFINSITKTMPEDDVPHSMSKCNS